MDPAEQTSGLCSYRLIHKVTYPISKTATSLKVVPLLLLFRLLSLTTQTLALRTTALVTAGVAATAGTVRKSTWLEAAGSKLLAHWRLVVHQMKGVLLSRTGVNKANSVRQITHLILSKEVKHRVHPASALIPGCVVLATGNAKVKRTTHSRQTW